jgi:hypothetical protein
MSMTSEIKTQLPNWWSRFVQLIAELPDRESPEDDPQAMVCSHAELESCYFSAALTADPASEKGEGLRTVCAKCGVDSRDSSQKYCGDGRDKENEHRWVRAPDDAAANRSRQTSDQARQFQDWLWNTGGASTINLAHAIAAKAAEIFGSPPEVIDKSFSCPECGGTHFGTADAMATPLVRECHDQLKVKCRWKGDDSECIVPSGVARRALSSAIDRRLAGEEDNDSLRLQLSGAEAILDAIERVIPRNEAHRDYAETVQVFVEELAREAAQKRHGASGICCSLREQEKRRADGLQAQLDREPSYPRCDKRQRGRRLLAKSASLSSAKSMAQRKT